MHLRHQLAAFSPISGVAIPRAVAAGSGLSPDPRSALLQLLLDEYDATHGVLCGSGTQALHIALLAAFDGVAGDRTAALPAFSCFDVAAAAIGAGVRPSFYDLDPETLGPDWRSFERVLDAGARIIVVAPLYGLPIDWTIVERIARRYDALVLEDAAQGFGGVWAGQAVGALGVISTLSFGRGKGWTGGSGGAVLVRGAARILTSLAPTAIHVEGATIAGLVLQAILGRPGVYGIPRSIPAFALGETRYHAPEAPTEMPRAAAAAVLANRAASLREVVTRRSTAALYDSVLGEGYGGRGIAVAAAAVPGYLRYPVRVNRSLRDRLLSAHGRRLGIERSYPFPLWELPALQGRMTGRECEFPGARALADSLVTAPTHSLLSAGERGTIADLLASR